MAVERELQLAGTDPKLRKRWNTLEDRRITPEKEIPPMEFLFELFNKPCFPRGELVAMTGKAKSGKTFMSTILMEKCLSGEGSDFIPCLRRVSDEPLRAMWFDTEQSEESTQDILRNRLIPMVSSSPVQTTPTPPRSALPLGSAKNLGGEFLDVFNVRGEFWQERLPLLEAAIGRFQPDLVILDGIRDLTDDINDGVKAQQVIERLMHMASARHCCIVCIMHQNKAQEDRSMRGWLGTELKNKSFETYECYKRDSVFSVKQCASRKFEISDNLEFTVDEKGLPRSLTQQEAQERSSSTSEPSAESMVRPQFNEKYILEHQPKFVKFNLPLLFGDALPNGLELDEQALMQKVMDLVSMTSPKLFYSVLNKAVKEGVVSQLLDNFNRKRYSLA